MRAQRAGGSEPWVPNHLLYCQTIKCSIADFSSLRSCCLLSFTISVSLPLGSTLVCARFCVDAYVFHSPLFFSSAGLMTSTFLGDCKACLVLPRIFTGMLLLLQGQFVTISGFSVLFIYFYCNFTFLIQVNLLNTI